MTDVERDISNASISSSLDLPPIPSSLQQNLQDSIRDLQQPQQKEQDEESGVAGTFGTTSSKSLAEYINTDTSSSSIISIANLLPSPSRSETPLTDHSSIHSSKNVELIITNLTTDREYYDDDISSGLDQESDGADSAVAKTGMAMEIKELPSPPITARSTKFSPKRILRRAKSSISDESVKKLGRRTSMFLEKFHYQQQELPPLPPLPDKSYTPPVPTTPTSLKSLRRQSSKLTNKGKTLSKKLRKAMSFHQTNQQQLV